jgi:lipopolysaccharide/colanic/teichoic acid biosynthesis glycosyltransferase
MKERSTTHLPSLAQRPFDVIFAAAGLLALAPLFVLLALLVLLSDGRPVFFGQTRVGKNGRLFRIWKFRTMRAGAAGRLVTAAGDSRVTKVGAFLRHFKLDELPQLFNVLRGDMSLVGPRPEVPQYVQLGAPLWQAVLRVRPGITDLATLLYRDEETLLGRSQDPHTFYRDQILPAKLRLNLAYLRSRTFRRDFRLILLTLRYSFFPRQIDADLMKRTFGIGVTE